MDKAKYEKETIILNSGDVIVAFTDGVTEVENPAGQEFGENAMIDFVKKNNHLPAGQMTKSLFKTIIDFSEKKKFRDDFTLIILKVK